MIQHDHHDIVAYAHKKKNNNGNENLKTKGSFGARANNNSLGRSIGA